MKPALRRFLTGLTTVLALLCVVAGSRRAVKVYDREGELVEVIADGTEFDAACKNMDLAVDGEGAIGVADTVGLSVAIFEPRPEPVATVAKGGDA